MWSIAIFSAREVLDTLSRSVSAALEGTQGREAVIDVMVNGNNELAKGCGQYVKTLIRRPGSPVTIRVWSIGTGDKAHAWNRYVYDIWHGSDIAYFIDGYVQVKNDALLRIADGLEASPHSLIASGVPTMGRSAKAHRGAASIHGNLYAVRGDVLKQLRALNFRHPLGLYWTDGLLGAVICFGFDPAKNTWDSSRILIEPTATWTYRPLRWWSVGDLRAHLKRMMRQAQGVLENLAIREHLAIQRKAPQALPETASELVNSWIKAFPRAALKTFLQRPLAPIVAYRIRHSRRDWSQTVFPPELVVQRRP